MSKPNPKADRTKLADMSKVDEKLVAKDELAELLSACDNVLAGKTIEEQLYLMGCAFQVAQYAASEAGVPTEKAMELAGRSQRDGKRFRHGAPKNPNPKAENDDLKARVAELEAKLAAKG